MTKDLKPEMPDLEELGRNLKIVDEDIGGFEGEHYVGYKEARAAEYCIDAARTLLQPRKSADGLAKLLDLAERAIGDHHAPNDCYSTGPLNGDATDLVCPACEFRAALEEYKK